MSGPLQLLRWAAVKLPAPHLQHSFLLGPAFIVNTGSYFTDDGELVHYCLSSGHLRMQWQIAMHQASSPLAPYTTFLEPVCRPCSRLKYDTANFVLVAEVTFSG